MKAERKSSQQSKFFSLDCVKESLVVFEINVALKGKQTGYAGTSRDWVGLSKLEVIS